MPLLAHEDQLQGGTISPAVQARGFPALVFDRIQIGSRKHDVHLTCFDSAVAQDTLRGPVTIDNDAGRSLVAFPFAGQGVSGESSADVAAVTIVIERLKEGLVEKEP